MKRTAWRQQGKGAFDLLEEATHLLRTAPAATLAVYFLGSIPFVLGLLFFWADMSRSPLAPQHLAGASFVLAALFFWMKFCHARFARRLRAQAAGEVFSPAGWRPAVRIFFNQAIIQSWGLLILPLALVPALPFAWVFAQFQNVTVSDDGSEASASGLGKKSWKLARLWPQQNHVLILVLIGFAFFVFLNWMTVCLALPQLGKMLFGVESVFTQSPYALLNTTFFAATAGLTYLCVDPIVKAVYVLRCFYGESLQSGEDLKTDLKPFVSRTLKTAAAVFILLVMAFTAPVQAESTNPTPPLVAGQKISPPDLDQTISQTIHERKYLWRMPREQVVGPDASQGVITRFINKAAEQIRAWARTCSEWLDKMWRKLFSHRSNHADSSAPGYGWIMSLQILLYGLIAAAIAALVIFLMRVWRNRRAATVTASEPIQPAPDLADENVRADQLPEDGWTRLARELLERGEFRLAMRAFYLASLAHLATRNLISIARFKSNYDYERELRRRAHAFPDLLTVFGDNLSIFERIWYGLHEVNDELVRQFAANVERLKAGG